MLASPFHPPGRRVRPVLCSPRPASARFQLTSLPTAVHLRIPTGFANHSPWDRSPHPQLNLQAGPRFPPKRSSRPAVKSPHASGRRTLRAHSSLSPTHRKSRGACVFFPRPFTQALLTRAAQVASPTYCHIFGSTRAGKIVNPSGVRDWHAGAFLILNETRFQPQVFNQILTTFPVVRSFPSVLNPLQSKSFWGSTRSRIMSAHRQNLSQPSRTAIKLSEHERAWPLRKSYLKHSPRNKKPPNFARETYNFCPQAIQRSAILLQPRAGLSSGGP